MGLAAKMYIKAGMAVRAVHLPDDVDLSDVNVAADPVEWDVTLWFVANGEQLTADLSALTEMWQEGKTFWLIYPKNGHLDTDLGRDKVFAMMNQAGMRGSRQVGIDEHWSCLYFKPKR